MKLKIEIEGHRARAYIAMCIRRGTDINAETERIIQAEMNIDARQAVQEWREEREPTQ